MTRVGDIVDPNETRGDLVAAAGYSESDATAAIAFAVWLRRGDLETGVDGQYARGELASHAYLELVAPEELRA